MHGPKPCALPTWRHPNTNLGLADTDCTTDAPYTQVSKRVIYITARATRVVYYEAMSNQTIFSIRTVGILLTIFGLIGMFASITLLHDTMELAKNPDFVPACSINPILSCSSVMASNQAELFGLPNPVFGIIAFTALLMFGVLITAKTVFPKLIWQLAIITAGVGVFFSHYLFLQSMFVLKTICPWCSLIWILTIAIFWLIASYALDREALSTTLRFMRIRKVWGAYKYVILIGWYAILLLIVFLCFSDYWLSLLP